MADTLTSEQRKRCMSRNKGRDTGPEMALRKELWKRGLRYRLHYKITGKPDIVFIGKRVAVFVDGCFWHGCPDHCVYPKTRSEFWSDKIKANIERDAVVSMGLRAQGWTVLRIWEHEIDSDLAGVVLKICAVLS